jgi:hypothetical protein
MPLARGGTGVSSITANRVLKSNTSTSVVEPLTGTGFIKLTSDVPSVGALVAADIPALDTSTVLIEDGTDIAARLVGFKSPSWHCDTAFSGQGFTWATDSGFGGAMSTTTISGTYLLLGNSSLAEHFAYKTPATTMSMYMRCVKGTSAVYVGIRFDDWNGSTVSNFAELRIAGATTRGIKFVVRRTGQSDATYYDNTIPAEFILWGYKGGSTDIRFTIFTSSSPSFGDRLLSVNPGWAATRYGIIASTGGTDSAYRNTIDFFHVV